MGLFGKKSGDGIGLLGTLAGMALMSHFFSETEKETRVVHEYVDKRAEQEEERREREHERQMEREERLERECERQMEREERRREAENPNAMEFVNKRVNDPTIFLIFVCIALLVFCFYILMSFETDTKYNLYRIICVLIVVGLGFCCLKIMQKRKKYKKYISLIIIQNYRDIMEIANQMKCSYDEACDNITYIISKGYIKGFYINKKNRMIIERKRKSKSGDDNSIYENANILKKEYSKNNVCPCCGGNKFVETSEGVRCKYCGNVMQENS